MSSDRNERPTVSGVNRDSGDDIDVSGMPKEWRNAAHAVITGDPTDDDAEYIDELFQENGVGVAPTLRGFPASLGPQNEESAVELKEGDRPELTYILQGRWTLDPVLANGNQAFRLLPADPYRRELFIRVEGATADNLAIGSSKADVTRQAQGSAHWTTTDVFYSQFHTGEVWVGGTDLSAARAVSYWAVTGSKPR